MAHVALCTAANSNIARSILRPAALSRRAAQTSLLVRCNATSNEDGSRPEEKPSTSSSDAFRGFGSPPDGAKKKMTTGEALRESLSSECAMAPSLRFIKFLDHQEPSNSRLSPPCSQA